jgi:hypothetical protein
MQPKAINYDELCPEIRDAVQFLRMEGFETIESGDGSLALEVDGAFDEPRILIQVSPNNLVDESHRLYSILLAEEVNAEVEGQYRPEDEVTIIVVYGPDLVNLGTKARELLINSEELGIDGVGC